MDTGAYPHVGLSAMLYLLLLALLATYAPVLSNEDASFESDTNVLHVSAISVANASSKDVAIDDVAQATQQQKNTAAQRHTTSTAGSTRGIGASSSNAGSGDRSTGGGTLLMPDVVAIMLGIVPQQESGWGGDGSGSAELERSVQVWLQVRTRHR